MKNKKGFTLIELLAIIVILAIIAVITVPIILNIIDNSKQGAAQDSAYGYKDAVNKWYVTKLSEDSTYNIPDGDYTTDQLKTLGVSVSGQEPETNSWVTIEKNNIITGCLQFDEYKVEIKDEKVGNAEKGECAMSLVHYTDSDNSGTINLGDFVKLGDDGFWVIASPEDGKVKLLAQYNLDSNSRQVTSNDGNYQTGTFSSSIYWWDSSSKKVKDGYTKDTYDYVYVYRDKDNNDTDNYLKTYVNNYKNYLVNDLGITGVSDARLMSYEEAIGTGCSTTSNSCPEYIANQFYWLGSTRDHDSDNVASGTMWNVKIGVRYIDSNYVFGDINSSRYFGVRPVIIIAESSLGIN